MRAAPGRAACVAAMIVGTVLAAAAGAVPAAGKMMPPLSGAAPETPAAKIAGGVPHADAGTAGLGERPADPGSQGGGSRLLRALAERPEPSDVTPVDTAPVFAAEGCPRALLRRLLAGAVGEAGALSALGIEREVLTLCRERQEIVAGLFETEALLRELRAPVEAPAPMAPATVPSAASAPATREIPMTEPPAQSRLRAALTAAAGTPAEPPAPHYGWFSIIGSAGALRAGVTDGQRVWFVREGDPLPNGGAIAAIAGRPPGVRVTGLGKTDGEQVLLPYRARPGGGP